MTRMARKPRNFGMNVATCCHASDAPAWKSMPSMSPPLSEHLRWNVRGPYPGPGARNDGDPDPCRKVDQKPSTRIAPETWLSGRKQPPAKRLGGSNSLGGSNPPVSAPPGSRAADGSPFNQSAVCEGCARGGGVRTTPRRRDG